MVWSSPFDAFHLPGPLKQALFHIRMRQNRQEGRWSFSVNEATQLADGAKD
jgi:hypothetical protein